MGLHELTQMLYRFEGLMESTFASRMQADGIAIANYKDVLLTAIELSQPKEKPKHTIADHYPAGGSPEPCSFCEKFGEIEDRLSGLRAAITAHLELFADTAYPELRKLVKEPE